MHVLFIHLPEMQRSGNKGSFIHFSKLNKIHQKPYHPYTVDKISVIWPESYHHYHLSFITFVSCCWPRVILGFFQGWKTQSCERSFEEDLHPFVTNGSFCGTGDFFGPRWYVAGLKVFSFQPQNGDVSSVLWRNFNLKFWFRHAKDVISSETRWVCDWAQ